MLQHSPLRKRNFYARMCYHYVNTRNNYGTFGAFVILFV